MTKFESKQIRRTAYFNCINTESQLRNVTIIYFMVNWLFARFLAMADWNFVARAIMVHPGRLRASSVMVRVSSVRVRGVHDVNVPW